MLNEQVGKLDAAVQKATEEDVQAKLLMTHPEWARTPPWPTC